MDDITDVGCLTDEQLNQYYVKIFTLHTLNQLAENTELCEEMMTYLNAIQEERFKRQLKLKNDLHCCII